MRVIEVGINTMMQILIGFQFERHVLDDSGNKLDGYKDL